MKTVKERRCCRHPLSKGNISIFATDVACATDSSDVLDVSSNGFSIRIPVP